MVPFLEKCALTNVWINLWIKNLCSSTEKLYAEVGKTVRVHPLFEIGSHEATEEWENL